ncbi:MFS transporter [Amycolatopsis jiangsuensis]|uniref:MFS family permease n=1 Tax=Amycolatopsis jiangsuensis TaxID=1181879 RepID=A0A840IQQ5_9PSEU|nr:MFS transporter [Amycolatopsis jiangsuensis]MBB4683508.1 MFS family permease [Amycolatopsis jiangsuensis]
MTTSIRPDDTGTGTRSSRWVALCVLLLAEAMNLLDTTIVQVAAPVIRNELQGDGADIQWFTAAYTLAFAVLLIPGGRIGDIIGRRRALRLGMTGFVLASLVCACALTPTMLITARAVQGAAAALVIPQTIGLIRAMFDGPDLGRAFGTIGPVMGLAAVCGPVLGGVLTSTDLFGSSWRSVFLVNVPLGVLTLVGTRLLPRSFAPHRPRFDVLGTLLVAAGSGLVIYPLIERAHWLLLGLGAVVLTGFAVTQRLRSAPLVEPSLFARIRFPAALVCSTLFYAVMQGLLQVFVLHAQLIEHAGALTTGLRLLPWSVAMGLAAVVAGNWLVPRAGGSVMYTGLAVLLAGVVTVLLAPDALPVALAVVGAGIGLFTAPFFTTALAKVRPEENGSAAGLLNAVQQFGGTLGVAALGSLFFTSGAGTALLTACGLSLLTVVAVAIMRSGSS